MQKTCTKYRAEGRDAYIMGAETRPCSTSAGKISSLGDSNVFTGLRSQMSSSARVNANRIHLGVTNKF